LAQSFWLWQNKLLTKVESILKSNAAGNSCKMNEACWLAMTSLGFKGFSRTPKQVQPSKNTLNQLASQPVSQPASQTWFKG